jgi:hypothetical protein
MPQRYVLPCLAVDEEELNQVQSQILTVVLRKLGFSSKTPTPLRYGPTDMGGLDLCDLKTEMGIAQLKLLRNAIFANTEVGKLAVISLKYSQIEAGTNRGTRTRNTISYSHVGNLGTAVFIPTQSNSYAHRLPTYSNARRLR